MTKQERITAPQVADRDATFMAVCRAISAAVSAAERLPDGQRVIGEVLAAGLETVGAGAPRYEPFTDMRDEAKWWADCATPVEVEIYLAAALRRLHGLNRGGFAVRARKRVFIELWSAMGAEDRQAFLAKVSGNNVEGKKRPRAG